MMGENHTGDMGFRAWLVIRAIDSHASNVLPAIRAIDAHAHGMGLLAIRIHASNMGLWNPGDYPRARYPSAV